MGVVRHVVNAGVLRERHHGELEHRAAGPDLGLDLLAEGSQVGDFCAQVLVVGSHSRVRLVEHADHQECHGCEHAEEAASAADHGHPVGDRQEPEEGSASTRWWIHGRTRSMSLPAKCSDSPGPRRPGLMTSVLVS